MTALIPARTHDSVWCGKCGALVPPLGPDADRFVYCGRCKQRIGVWLAGVPALLPVGKDKRPAAPGRKGEAR